MMSNDTKILYIAPQISKASGGKLVSQRNKEILRLLASDDCFFCYEVKRNTQNPLKMLWNDIKERSFYGLNSSDKKKIIQCIKRNNISIVFLDSSNLGGVVKYIKRHCRTVKVITFFHNVEIDFTRMSLKLSKRWHLFYRIWLSKYNESQAIHLSDSTICLNQRDATTLFQKYKKNIKHIIPVTLDSKIDNISINKVRVANRIPNLLFFGSNFPPNIEGIKLFVEKVMPNITGFLTIAGQGMEQIKAFLPSSKNINIMGYIENIDELYYNADIVILPIFSGSGMKVKTAEALKYGKFIIASDEALEGYDVDNLKGVIRCSCIENFASAINDFSHNYKEQNSFIEENRQRFLNLYSNEVALKRFKYILEELNSNQIIK